MRALLVVALFACGSEPPRPAPVATSSGCVALDRDGRPAPRGDAIARALAQTPACPSDLSLWEASVTHDGAKSAIAMVNNRGFHSGKGSYSFFEMVTGSVGGVTVAPGELFFGHFVHALGDELRLEQDPMKDALMIELVAWDPSRGVYNFYEMIGDGSIGRWFYRGDSIDIADDNANLHQGGALGKRLRCSGCHVGGGPIMKELTPPYNDWARADRPLPLHGRQPDAHVRVAIGRVVDAEELADAVNEGIDKLHASPAYRKQLAARPLREQLRPLFCPEEINFASSNARSDGTGPIDVPPGFFVDARLADDPLEVPRAHYAAALARLGANLPETARSDADHAWLAPVKAASDRAKVDLLIALGTIDREFVFDVLAIDLPNPALSPIRCGLLRSLPAAPSAGWQAAFAQTLAASPQPGARELAANLTDPKRTADAHRARAQQLLAGCRQALADPQRAGALVELLAQRRAEVAANAISKNPRGQILEPGFRVIFPTTNPAAVPDRLQLSETCDVR